MNLGAVVDVAIGLIFVWIVLSLSIIQIQEWINIRLDKRARDMEEAIHEMLANPNLKAQFYDHPIIRGLTAKKRNEPSRIPSWFYRYPILRGFTKEIRKLPSYIPSQQFSLALFEITMTAGTGIDAQCHTSGAVRKLPPAWEENLLRIGQEALANALKHGTPRNICVELRFDAEEIDLSLRDDGTGFDPAAPTSGMGLTGMRERAARLGWRLDVRSRLGEGSEVFVSLRPPG